MRGSSAKDGIAVEKGCFLKAETREFIETQLERTFVGREFQSLSLHGIDSKMIN